jgi:hypothetical protein
MTKLTLQQLKNHENHKVIKKLYFKKYPYCLRYGNHHSEYIDMPLDIRKRNIQDDINNIKAHVRQKFKNSKQVRVRHEWTSLSLFFENESDFVDVASSLNRSYKKILFSVETPISNDQIQFMKDNEIVEIREKLIYNKYRYKLESYRSYTPETVDQWIELGKMIQDNFAPEDYKLNYNLYWVLNHPEQAHQQLRWIGTLAVYFKNYNDVCSIKFIHNNIIKKMVKVALHSEITEDDN